MTNPKPSIILVPGSFALPEFYDNLTTPITEAGYEIQALHLPSVGLKSGPRPGTPPSMYDDAAFIAAEARKLADQGKDVILVAHSYGGVPATQSTEGLSKQERKEQGQKGGIVNIAYMTCLVPPIGGSAMSVLAEVAEANKTSLEIMENGWMRHNDIPRSARLSFSDLPQDQAEDWVRRMPTHSAASFASELTHAGYVDVPVSYLLCEEDLVIPLQNQTEGIEMVEKASGRKVDVTKLKMGHCPSTTEAGKVAVLEWIWGVVRKVEGINT